MLIIPAIDIREGRCVRLLQGEASREVVYADDPVRVALEWSRQGARWLHIIDLDGAFAGRPMHLDLMRSIAAAVEIPIQVGGGFRRVEDIDAALAAGAARVIIGTAAMELAAEAGRRYSDRVVVSLDVRDGKVAVEGWTALSEHDAVTMGRELARRGITRFVYTDIGRDGMLAGPNVSGVRAFVEAVRLPVLAAGGISSEDDIAALLDAGVEGVIVGRALYERQVDLRAAITRWENTHAH